MAAVRRMRRWRDAITAMLQTRIITNGAIVDLMSQAYAAGYYAGYRRAGVGR